MSALAVGRAAELSQLTAFLGRASSGLTALLLSGEAGIGKTTLWQEALTDAAERSFHVLACRPAEGETQLPFAALADLLDGVTAEAFRGIPEAQRDAVQAALMRRRSRQPRPEPLAVSLGVLGIIRSAARDKRVVIAIDDVPWLDRPSARVLEYVVRRLQPEPVAVLASLRTARPHEPLPALLRAIPSDRLERIAVGPLDLEAMDRVLRCRLGTGLLRPTLLQVHRSSGGNPFFALEIARGLVREGLTSRPEALPVPQSLTELVEDRLGALPAGTRDALLVTAALSQPTVELVKVALGRQGRGVRGLAEAVVAGVVEIDGQRVRFAHPLLASAVYTTASSERRRRVHRRLARILTDPEERARHMALAAEHPSSTAAAALDDAARRARARGAPESAAELSEQAGRLTPVSLSGEARRRIIEAADYHLEAGDTARARRLLENVVSSTAAGAGRAEALTHLAQVRLYADDWWAALELLEQALEESGEELHQRMAIELGLAGVGWMTLHDLPTAAAHAASALRAAERLREPALVAEALGPFVFWEGLLGRGIRADLMERAMQLEETSGHLRTLRLPSYSFAEVLMWTGDLDASRSRLSALHERALRLGDWNAIPFVLKQLSIAEWRAGDWRSAGRHAHEADQAALQTGQEATRAFALSAKALIHAHEGQADLARTEAEEGLRLACRTGAFLAKRDNLSVLGFLELSLGNPSAAYRHLEPLLEPMVAAGIKEPAVYGFLPDEIEALVALGELDKAGDVLNPFEQQGNALDRPRVRAAAARCRGLLCAARGDLSDARAAVADALEQHTRMKEPFELGRTLLVTGEIARRNRDKGTARGALEAALRIFDGLSAPIWSRRAHSELLRVDGRIRSPGLSPTEASIAELVAAGRTNREVAAVLFMSVHTVEWHLTRIYRMLGLRSRTELAARGLLPLRGRKRAPLAAARD